MRGPRLSEPSGETHERWPEDVDRAGVHPLSSPVSVHDKKQTCSMIGEIKRQRTSAKPRRNPDRGSLHLHWVKELASLCFLIPSLTCLRFSPAIQRAPIRHTLGWRPAAAAKPAGPRSATVPSRAEGGGMRGGRGVGPFSDGRVASPMEVPVPPTSHSWLNESFAEGSQ